MRFRLSILILAGGLSALPLWAETAVEKPLPPMSDTLGRVVARAAQETQNDQSFAARYSFCRSKVLYYRNGQGEFKNRKTVTSMNSPMVAEDADRSEPILNLRGAMSPRDFDKSNLLANARWLERFDFKFAGRETVGGHELLVMDFQPKREALPEQGLRDRFVNRTAGRIWVDEADAVVVRADLHLTERVEILNGVAGVVAKFTYYFDRERTAEGLWYVRDKRWHFEGRAVGFNRNIDCHETKTGVRRVAALVKR